MVSPTFSCGGGGDLKQQAHEKMTQMICRCCKKMNSILQSFACISSATVWISSKVQAAGLMKSWHLVTTCFKREREDGDDDGGGQRRQEEDHARPIVRSLVAPGTTTIDMANVPKLFELLGVPYSPHEHALALEKLTSEGRIHEDDFIAWYLDWMFGEDDSEDEQDGTIESESSVSVPTKKSQAELAAEWATFQPAEGFWRCATCASSNPSATHESPTPKSATWTEGFRIPELNTLTIDQGSDLISECDETKQSTGISVGKAGSSFVQASTGLSTHIFLSSAVKDAGSIEATPQIEIREANGITIKTQQTVRTLELMNRCKVTTLDICMFKDSKKPITMATAYNYPSAVHVDLAGFDILLVDDSLGGLELGMDSALSVTLDDMIYHTRAVRRGAKRPLVVTDMPFGSYEGDLHEALHNAQRILKEGGADCVKIKGGRKRVDTIKALVDAGIAVIAHIGQLLGRSCASVNTAAQAKMIIEDALAVQVAGAFAVVLECVPTPVAKHITELLKIPTIGIGAGPETDGQVLIFHDLLGMLQHPHHEQHAPKFCKQYVNVSDTIRLGLEDSRDDVENRRFPNEDFNPFKMSTHEAAKLDEIVASTFTSE